MNPTLKVGDRIRMEIEASVSSVHDCHTVFNVTGTDGFLAISPDHLAAAKITVLPPEWRVGMKVLDKDGDEAEIVAPPRPRNGREEVAVWSEEYGYYIQFTTDLERLP